MTDNSKLFWLVLREPGMRPRRKGSWPLYKLTEIMCEFINAHPNSYIDVLTVGDDGSPDIQHGPEALQSVDLRFLKAGREHNRRIEAAECKFRSATVERSPCPKCGLSPVGNTCPTDNGGGV